MGFATHFMADLYMCQNQLWLAPFEFMENIRNLASFKNIADFEWVFQSIEPNRIRIGGEFADSFILIQVFPGQNFLTIDLFSWQPKVDIKNFSEALIEIFAPQVVATESKVRAEHLQD